VALESFRDSDWKFTLGGRSLRDLINQLHGDSGLLRLGSSSFAVRGKAEGGKARCSSGKGKMVSCKRCCRGSLLKRPDQELKGARRVSSGGGVNRDRGKNKKLVHGRKNDHE